MSGPLSGTLPPWTQFEVLQGAAVQDLQGLCCKSHWLLPLPFFAEAPGPKARGELPQVSLPPNSHWGRSREGKGQPGPRSSSFQHTMMVTVAMSAQQGGVLWAVPPGVTHTSEQKHVSSPAYAPHVYSAPRSPGLCPAVCRPTSSVRPILCKIKHQFSSSATKRWGVGENIFLASCWEDG